MNRADVKIEDKEVTTDNPGGESIGASVLRRGWWIGKRVAIAGAAITSAPIILPPILVLSILGIAISLPYGIYLAVYACADKIMRALLPLPERKRENDPPNLSQERLSVVEVRGEAKSDESLEEIQPKELMEGQREQSQRVQDEERLWDQIYAMRTIIGSKAMVRASIGEELTALFLSVGMEPPLSLKNSPVLSDIIDGLRVLKSVIGVK
ncbi:hypothetical protein KSP40_PGU016506 [Platanthera guangdongensis]|uniref:Uncharacterized protein n=1 Tax=Platanthera guangdongensis TaxID=2320717 RepID=A0ABR2LDS6_9ASPA